MYSLADERWFTMLFVFKNRLVVSFSVVVLTLLALLNACTQAPPVAPSPTAPASLSETPAQLSPPPQTALNTQLAETDSIPPLPFPDNPDPALCGIPKPWGNNSPAYLNGYYQGNLIRPVVFLYDSHLRREIQAHAPHGAAVKILLSQSNPELDYYLVKVLNAPPPNEGWVPAPFVSFEPLVR
jgi:hypothetical protein